MSLKLYVAIIVLATGILLAYGIFDPATYSFFPKCPFHSLTGFDCPGCGSQRAIHSLLNGNLTEAADYNLLLVASIPLLVVHFGYKAASVVKQREIRLGALDHSIMPVIIFILVLGFAILRNLQNELGFYLKA